MVVGSPCKHSPKKLFAKQLVCKRCGKSIVSKSKIPIIVACVVAVMINIYIRFFYFEDSNLLVTSVTFLVVTAGCLFLGWIVQHLLGYKEKPDA